MSHVEHTQSELKLSGAHFADLLEISALTLATTGQGGEPHAASLYFVADQALNLYFFSDPDSQHGQDIAVNPQSAITIYPECQGWQDIRGLQMRGKVYLVQPGSDWEAAWEAYQTKFPFVTSLKAVVARNALYVFKPKWIRLVDNRLGFGHKDEWTLT